MVVLGVPTEASATGLGRAALWMLERFADGMLSAVQASDPDWCYPVHDVADRQRLFGVFRRPISRVLGYEEVNGVARFRVLDDRGRPMVVRVLEHPDHPGRVWKASMMLDPPGVAVRPATEADGPALRSLELTTPVLHDGFTVAYDRPDPFAQDRLRPLPVFRSVAMIDARVVGMHADACHVVQADEGPVPVIYRHHTRIHPDMQGAGLMPALNGFHSELVRRDGVDRTILSFTASGNTKMARFKAGGSGGQRELEWATRIVRVVLDTAALQRSCPTRPARAADDTRVAELLEAAHGRSVFWPHGGKAWVTDRMSRSPADYSWHNLVMADHACVGVWDAGWSAVRTDETETTASRVATVLDWGFDPDHPDALDDCLRAACLAASQAGIDQLYAFYGPPTPGTNTFEQLGSEFDQFTVNTTVAEPADITERGIYVDPVYF